MAQAAAAQAAAQEAATEGATRAAAATRQQEAIAALASLEAKVAEESKGEAVAAGAAGATVGTLVSCAVRFPDGSRCTFSLRASAPLAALFWSVDARGPPPGLPEGRVEYALATQYPRRRWERPRSGDSALPHGPTLREAGLADSRQQAFFVEARSDL